MNEQFQSELTEWRQITEWLDNAKKREAVLRVSLAKQLLPKAILPDGSFPEGTTNETVGNLKVKVVGKLNRTVLEELEAATMAEADLGEEYAGLIRRKPELAVGVYKRLPMAKRLIVDRMLLIKPATITLEISEEK